MQFWGQTFAVALLLQGLLATLISSASAQLTLEEFARRYTERTPGGGIHVPILRWGNVKPAGNLKRAPSSGTVVGFGDLYDLIYSALVTINGTTTPLVVDTGSSDLWVVSNTCVGCGNANHYQQTTFRSADVGVQLTYGDSQSGTYASGLVGFDTVTIGGTSLTEQSLVAVNRTNSTITRGGMAGILGLGFPINSAISTVLFKQQRQPANSSISTRREVDKGNRQFPDFLPGSHNSRRQTIPPLSEIVSAPPDDSHHQTRQSATSSPADVQAFIDTWNTTGPFVTRLIAQGALPEPLIAITLQRNTMDIGGNFGMLSIGEMPAGVNSSDLTWVYLRNYTSDLGGLPGPAGSPSEVYPITWEIMVDNVYFDGERLPMSNSTPPGIGLSALVDSGTSYLHGPQDVVSYIQQRLSPIESFSCAQPHNLSFEIGGKLFPVDPRDFATQATGVVTDGCMATLTGTDPPRAGDYLFSWILGVPFLKGVLASFYFGNIPYPSHDAPKIGFLSTVPSNAGDRMKTDAAAAIKAGAFPAISQAPPSVVVPATATNSHGVPQANTPVVATITTPTTTNNLKPTSQSGESCYMVCSSFSYISWTACFASIVASWNMGLW